MLQATAYRTDIEKTLFPPLFPSPHALKAQSDSEGFDLRVAPIDSTERQKVGCPKCMT